MSPGPSGGYPTVLQGGRAPGDQELVRRAQQGDNNAFEILIGRYEKKITNHIYAMLRDYDRALDLAQETFLRLLTRVDAYRETARFSTWLYRISTNLAIDEIRRRRRWRMVPILGKGDEEWQPPGTQAPGGGHPPPPDAPLLEDETRTMERQAVATLPAHYRSALVLKDLQDMPYEEVAEILEIPVGTVKSRVNRARTMLKDSLQPFFSRTSPEERAACANQSSGKTV